MTETTAVATREENAVATNDPVVETGLEELDPSDLVIPRLSITQPTSPDVEEENKGKFSVNVTMDYLDTMHVALIKLSKSRILFPAKYNRDNEPLCRSFDFKFPADTIESPMAEHCGLLPGEKKKHLCEYANWGADGSAPRCMETWDLLIVDLDTYMPMWFSLKSTALKPLRKIISAISMIAKAKKVPMWRLGFSMSLEKVVNQSGTFFVPVFSGLAQLEAADAENMDLIREQLVSASVQDSAEADHDDVPLPNNGESSDAKTKPF